MKKQEKDLQAIGHSVTITLSEKAKADKGGGMSFIPAPIRRAATNALKKKLKQEGITSVLLIFDESQGEGMHDHGNDNEVSIDEFSAHFFGHNLADFVTLLMSENAKLRAEAKRAKFFEDQYRQANGLPTRQQEQKAITNNHE